MNQTPKRTDIGHSDGPMGEHTITVLEKMFIVRNGR